MKLYSLRARIANPRYRGKPISGGFVNANAFGELGIEGSPASLTNIQLNYHYTPAVVPLLKF